MTRPPPYRRRHSRLASEHDAEDLAQEARLKFFIE